MRYRGTIGSKVKKSRVEETSDSHKTFILHMTEVDPYEVIGYEEKFKEYELTFDCNISKENFKKIAKKLAFEQAKKLEKNLEYTVLSSKLIDEWGRKLVLTNTRSVYINEVTNEECDIY